MTDDDQKRIFDPSRFEDEIVDRWGDTDSYAVSRRRVASYTDDDRARQRAESNDNVETFADLMRSGVPPTDPRAIEAAREHGSIIDRWFYPLSPEAHLGLAQMYLADPRFEAVYEDAHAGLTRYITDAIVALHSN